MSERCEIARSTNRTLGRDHWYHAFFKHGLDECNEFEPHARCTTAKRNEFQRHDEAHDVFAQRFTHATAMRQDQIALKCCHVFGSNTDRGKLTKAGIDAINRCIARGDFGDACRCLFNALMKGRINAGGEIAAIDLFKYAKRNAAGTKNEGHGKLHKSASRKV